MTRTKSKRKQKELAAARFTDHARSTALFHHHIQHESGWNEDVDADDELIDLPGFGISKSQHERSSPQLSDERPSKKVKHEEASLGPETGGSLPLFVMPNEAEEMRPTRVFNLLRAKRGYIQKPRSYDDEVDEHIAGHSRPDSGKPSYEPISKAIFKSLDTTRNWRDVEQDDLPAEEGNGRPFSDAEEDIDMASIPARMPKLNRLTREQKKSGKQRQKFSGSLTAENFIPPTTWQNYGQHCPSSQEGIQIKLEEEEEPILPKRIFIILYGYTWGNRIVNTPFVLISSPHTFIYVLTNMIQIQEILKRCTPMGIDLSTEVSEHEKDYLRLIYGVETDFVKLEFGNKQDQSAAIEALREMKLPSCCPGSSLKICEYPGTYTLSP